MKQLRKRKSGGGGKVVEREGRWWGGGGERGAAELQTNLFHVSIYEGSSADHLMEVYEVLHLCYNGHLLVTWNWNRVQLIRKRSGMEWCPEQSHITCCLDNSTP